VVEDLIKEKLVDYIAMDIKAPLEKYAKVTCRVFDLADFQKSVILIKESGLPHEFRSTVLPALHSKEDILEMARQVKGADKYFLQSFKPEKKLVNPNFSQEKSFTIKELNDVILEIKDWFNVCKLR